MTMKQYLGAKVIHAEPQEKEGKDGYKVVYPDGYSSWSPKAAFDEAYRQTDNMSFGLAIEAMKKGHRVARAGWNGKGVHIALQTPTDQSKMTLPYIFMKTVDDQLVPWLASQTDMLTDDWTTAD